MNQGLVSSAWVHHPFLPDRFKISERPNTAAILTQVIHDGLRTDLPLSRWKLRSSRMKLLSAFVLKKTSGIPLSAKRGGGKEEEEEKRKKRRRVARFFPYTTLFLCNVSEGVVKSMWSQRAHSPDSRRHPGHTESRCGRENEAWWGTCEWLAQIQKPNINVEQRLY